MTDPLIALLTLPHLAQRWERGQSRKEISSQKPFLSKVGIRQGAGGPSLSVPPSAQLRDALISNF